MIARLNALLRLHLAVAERYRLPHRHSHGEPDEEDHLLSPAFGLSGSMLLTLGLNGSLRMFCMPFLDSSSLSILDLFSPHRSSSG